MKNLFPWVVTSEHFSFKAWMVVLWGNAIHLALYTTIVVGIWKLLN